MIAEIMEIMEIMEIVSRRAAPATAFGALVRNMPFDRDVKMLAVGPNER